MCFIGTILGCVEVLAPLPRLVVDWVVYVSVRVPHVGGAAQLRLVI